MLNHQFPKYYKFYINIFNGKSIRTLNDWTVWFCIACHVIFPRQYGQTNNRLPGDAQPTVSHFVSDARWRVHCYVYNMSLLFDNKLWCLHFKPRFHRTFLFVFVRNLCKLILISSYLLLNSFQWYGFEIHHWFEYKLILGTHIQLSKDSQTLNVYKEVCLQEKGSLNLLMAKLSKLKSILSYKLYENSLTQ